MIQGGRPNQNADQYWSSTSFTYKFCCMTSSIIFFFSLFIPVIALFLIDIPSLTIWSFQIWKLFLSMYGQMPSLLSILGILFAFMWLHRLMKDDSSTVYSLVQVVILNFQLHLLFNLICFLLSFVFNIQGSEMFLAYGWFPIIVMYEFRDSVVDPQGQKRFCCLPFLIKSKYFPWVILVFSIFFTGQPFIYPACAVLGYYQQVIRKQMLIKLPFSFYKKLQSCLPDSVKQRHDFVKISNVQNILLKKCWKCSQAASNPFDGRSQQNNNNNGVFFSQNAMPAAVYANKGVSIGGRPAADKTDYKNIWALREQKQSKQQNKQKQKIQQQMAGDLQNKQLQIEPSKEYKHNFPQQNSYALLHQNSPPTAELLKQFKKEDKNDLI